MKKRIFLFDRSLYEVITQNQLSTFNVKTLRDLFAARVKAEGVQDMPLAEVRLYVYEYLRRMVKVGWARSIKKEKKRGQMFELLEQPARFELQLIDSKFIPETTKIRVSEENTAAPMKTSEYQSVLENQLKALELDMLAAMGEVERYKLLMQELPELSSQLQIPYNVARETSSKLIGHFRAVETTLQLIQAA